MAVIDAVHFANYFRIQGENDSTFSVSNVTGNSFTCRGYISTYGHNLPDGGSADNYMSSPYVGILASKTSYFVGIGNTSEAMSTLGSNLTYSTYEDATYLYHPMTSNNQHSQYYDFTLSNSNKSSYIYSSAITGNTKYYLYSYVLPSGTDLTSSVSSDSLNFYNVYSSWDSIYHFWAYSGGAYYQPNQGIGLEVITPPSEYLTVTVNQTDIDNFELLKDGQMNTIYYGFTASTTDGSEVADIRHYYRYKYDDEEIWSSWTESNRYANNTSQLNRAITVATKRGHTLSIQFAQGNIGTLYSQPYYTENNFLSTPVTKTFSIQAIYETGELKKLETPKYTVEIWKSRLSDEAKYQFVDYVDMKNSVYNSARTFYVDFGKNFNELYSMTAEFDISLNSSATYQQFFGIDPYVQGGFSVVFKYSSGQWGIALNKNKAEWEEPSSLSYVNFDYTVGDILNLKIETSHLGSVSIYVNKTLVITGSFSSLNNQNNSVCLGNVVNYYGSLNYYTYNFRGKIHSIKIECGDSASEKAYYVMHPAYDKNTNLPGFYDTKNRCFYGFVGRNLVDISSRTTNASNAGIAFSSYGEVYDSTPTEDARTWSYANRNWTQTYLYSNRTYVLEMSYTTVSTNTNSAIQVLTSGGAVVIPRTNTYGIEKYSKTFSPTSSGYCGIELKVFDGRCVFSLREDASTYNTIIVGPKSTGTTYGKLVDISNIAINDLRLSKERNVADILEVDIEYVQLKKKLEAEQTKVTDVIKPYLVDVVVRRNFETIFSGVMMYAKATLQAVGRQTLTIKAVGYGEELSKRYINCSYGNMNYPQMARQIIYDAQHEMNWIDNYDFLSEQTDSADENDTSYFNGWGAEDADYVSYIPVKTADTDYYLAHWQNGSIPIEKNCKIKCYKLTCSKLKGKANQFGTTGNFTQYLYVEFWHALRGAEVNNQSKSITLQLSIDTDADYSAVYQWTTEITFISQPSSNACGSQWTKFSGFFDLGLLAGFVKHVSIKNISDYTVYINDIVMYRPSDEEHRKKEFNTSATASYDLNIGVGYFDPAFDNEEYFSKDRVRHYHRQNAKEAIYNLAKLEDQNFEYQVDKDGQFIIKQAEGDLVVRNVATYPGQISEISIERDADNLYNVGCAINTHLYDNKDLITQQGQSIQYSDLTNGVAIDEESCAKYRARVQMIQVDTTTRREIETEAQGAIYASDEIQDIPTLKFDSNIYNPGNIHIGDAFGIDVDIDDNFNFVNGEYRVYGYDLNLSRDHVENMDITLSIPSAVQLQLMTFPVTMKNMMNNVKRLQIKSNK